MPEPMNDVPPVTSTLRFFQSIPFLRVFDLAAILYRRPFHRHVQNSPAEMMTKNNNIGSMR
jgi:hypothetical protein